MHHCELARSDCTEAIRCLYLAGELRRLGHDQAAERWQAKAAACFQSRSQADEGDGVASLASVKAIDTTAAPTVTEEHP